MRTFRNLTAVAALAACAGATLTVAPPVPAQAQSTAGATREFIEDLPSQNWLNVVEATDKGHRAGNPEAEAALIEFISYTCGHCATFAMQSDNTLDIAAVGPGYISVEVRPVIRNYLDMVATLLVQCGDPAGFKGRHRAFLYSQDTWLTKAINAPQSQQQVWARGTPDARINAAQALGFYDIMRAKGYEAPDIDRCLRDEAKVANILANDQSDREQFSITGTPTFALDGKTLEAGDWSSLARTLQERFRPEPQESVTGG